MISKLLKKLIPVLLLFFLISAKSSPNVINPFQKAMRSIEYGQTYCPDAYSEKAITLLKKSLRYAYPQCLFLDINIRSPAQEKQLAKGFNATLALAKSGIAAKQYIVAMAYLYGVGVKYNVKKYFFWIKKAADQNNEPAKVQYLISIMTNLNSSIGTPIDNIISSEKAARNHLIKLAKNGNFKAFLYTVSYLYKKQPDDTFVLSKKFADESKQAQAYGILGSQYMMNSQHKNYHLAWYWTKKAIDSGLLDTKSYAANLSSLGVLCFLMKGCSTKQGKHFLRQSALLNYRLSKQLLTCLEKHTPRRCGIA